MTEIKKTCEHCKKEFLVSEGELSMYEKTGTELPRLCFLCRVSLHFSIWQFARFRKTVSDLSGETLITQVSLNKRYPLCSFKEWHSDMWDGMDHGREYDSSRPFFEQIKELQEKIPRPHQQARNNTNCDWCDDTWSSKECYLSRSVLECEELHYAYRVVRSKNSIDLTFCFDMDSCFECIYCFNSYDLHYSHNSRDCMNSYFLFDCRNCSNCFMCSNLRGKSHCIENVQYTKEEYLEKLKSFGLTSHEKIQEFKKKFADIIRNNAVHRENFNLRTTNSEGEYLADVNNCHNCFQIQTSEHCYDCLRGLNNKMNIDANGAVYSELIGNSSCCLSAYGLKYCSWSQSRYSEYLDICSECEYCFGCVGLKKKKYCILNKQYSKEEYEVLKEKIIADMKQRGEYGQFFPYELSPIPYNFSVSYLYFPEKTKEDIEKLGGYWEDTADATDEGIPTDGLPDDIRDVSESISKQALVCPKSGWRFNVAQKELQFYKQKGIPLPREHFDVRARERIKYFTVLTPFDAECCFCKKKLAVYYRPEWGYKKIACESCYQKEVI